MTKIFTTKEVEQHSDRSDIWMVIEGKVYDLTSFLEDHPGGEEVLLELAGRDGSEPFDEIGHSEGAKDLLKKFYVGDLDPAEATEKKETKTKATPAYPKSETKGSALSNLLLVLPIFIAGGFAAYNHYANGTV